MLFKLIVHLLRNKVLYLKFYWQSFILNSAIDLFPRNLTNLARTVISQNTLEQSSLSYVTAQKIKFSIKNFFSKYDQIRRKLRIWSYLLILNGKLHFLCSVCSYNLIAGTSVFALKNVVVKIVRKMSKKYREGM